jgi:hypothetical protein
MVQTVTVTSHSRSAAETSITSKLKGQGSLTEVNVTTLLNLHLQSKGCSLFLFYYPIIDSPCSLKSLLRGRILFGQRQSIFEQFDAQRSFHMERDLAKISAYGLRILVAFIERSPLTSDTPES